MSIGNQINERSFRNTIICTNSSTHWLLCIIFIQLSVEEQLKKQTKEQGQQLDEKLRQQSDEQSKRLEEKLNVKLREQSTEQSKQLQEKLDKMQERSDEQIKRLEGILQKLAGEVASMKEAIEKLA